MRERRVDPAARQRAVRLSSVTADVPSYTIVAGNPARVVRPRFGPYDIERLQRVAWWSWPVERVSEHAEAIMAGTPAQLEALAPQL